MVGLVVRFRVSGSPDLTYNQLLISLWAGAEVSTGLICVCLPELPALFPRLRQQTSRYGHSGSGNMDGTPSISNGPTSTARAYSNNRGKQPNGDMVMGKRDLEYGQVLLDDDSDTAVEATIEMQSRGSSSREDGSEKDIGLAVGDFPQLGRSAENEARDRIATRSRARRGETGIMKTISMEVTSKDRGADNGR